MDKTAQFGNNIKRLRKWADLTQAELAEKLFVLPQAVSAWEIKGAEPDSDTLLRIVKLFGISLDALMGKDTHLACEYFQKCSFGFMCKPSAQHGDDDCGITNGAYQEE